LKKTGPGRESLQQTDPVRNSLMKTVPDRERLKLTDTEKNVLKNKNPKTKPFATNKSKGLNLSRIRIKCEFPY
jgi:hypothetical protein